VLRTQDDGPVRIIILNRPHVLNAVNGDLAEAIDQALTDVDEDPEIRVGVLAGTGRVFCAGADLNAINVENHRLRIGDKGFAGIARRDRIKPLVAAVEGAAVGGGFEICLAVDMVTAASDAIFALPEVLRSRLAGGGGLLRIGRTLPVAVAMEIGLTGRPIGAERAYQLGLVNRVTEPGAALASALELARAITAGAPQSVAASRRIIVAAATRPEEDVWTMTREEGTVIRRSSDSIEGPRAFVEKRPPRWTGH
jgi:enoyl-CoA hydratase